MIKNPYGALRTLFSENMSVDSHTLCNALDLPTGKNQVRTLRNHLRGLGVNLQLVGKRWYVEPKEKEIIRK